MTREELTTKLSNLRLALNAAYEAYTKALESGKASYTIGSRSLTNLTPEQIWTEIQRLENEIARTENQLKGVGTRKAIGIIRRDW